MMKRASYTSAARLYLAAALLFLPACAKDRPLPATGSVGAVLAHDEGSGALLAHDVPEGLGADRAGLEPGDRIKMIDGILVDGLPRERVVELLRGPVGSEVVLTVIRGDEVLHLTVVRHARAPAQSAEGDGL